MKKYFNLMLVIALCLCMTGCSKEEVLLNGKKIVQNAAGGIKDMFTDDDDMDSSATDNDDFDKSVNDTESVAFEKQDDEEPEEVEETKEIEETEETEESEESAEAESVAIPSDFTAESSELGIKISWKSVEGAEGYQIFKKDENGEWTDLETVFPETDYITDEYCDYEDQDVLEYEQNSYTVACIDQEGNLTSARNEAGITGVYVKPVEKVSVKNVDDGVKISWDLVPNISRYDVYKSNGTTWNKVGEATTAEFTDLTASQEEAYQYSVACVYEDGTEEYSSAYGQNFVSEKIIFVEPAGNLSTKLVKKGIEISWDANENADSYNIFRKSGKGKWKKIGSTEEARYNDQDVKSAKDYKYSVQCVRETDVAYVSTYGQNAVKCRYLGCVSKKSIKFENSKKGISVTWGKVSGATGYNIYRAEKGGSESQIAMVSAGKKLTFVDKKTENGKEYTYGISAVCDKYDQNNGSPETLKNFVRVDSVSIKKLTSKKTGCITAKWSNNKQATGFELQYSKNSDMSGKKTIKIKGKSEKQIKKLETGTYYVRVRAYKTVGKKKYYSTWSAKKKVKTKEPPYSKTMTISTSTVTETYNSKVGSNYSYNYMVNDKLVYNGSTIKLKEGDTIRVKASVVEEDSNPDVGYDMENITVTKKDLTNGFTCSFGIVVTENGGRYRGQSSAFSSKISFY